MKWVWFALISAGLVALSNITRKQGLKKEHALEFATTRTLLSSIIVLAAIPFFGFSMPPVSIIFLMFLLGFLAAFGQLFFTKAYRHLDVSVVAPLRNLGPAFLLVLSIVFLKEAVTRNQLLGIGLLLVGSYVLQADHNFTNIKGPFIRLCKSKYHHFVIFGIIIYSFTAMLDKIVIDKLVGANLRSSPIFVMLIFVWVSMSITLSAMTAIKFKFFSELKHAWHNGWIWIVLSSLCTFGATLTYYGAISLAFVSLVIPIKRLSTLFETVIGGELFHEKGLLMKSVACIIMIAGAILVIL